MSQPTNQPSTEVAGSKEAGETVLKEETSERKVAETTVKTEEKNEKKITEETVSKEDVSKSKSTEETISKGEIISEVKKAEEIVKKEEIIEERVAVETVKKEENCDRKVAEETVKKEEIIERKVAEETIKKEENHEKKLAVEEVFEERKIEPVESLKDVASDLSDAAKGILQTVMDKIDDKIEKRVETEEAKTIEVNKKAVEEAVCTEKKVQPLGAVPAEVQKPISKLEDKAENLSAPAQQSSNAQTKDSSTMETNDGEIKKSTEIVEKVKETGERSSDETSSSKPCNVEVKEKDTKQKPDKPIEEKVDSEPSEEKMESMKVTEKPTPDEKAKDGTDTIKEDVKEEPVKKEEKNDVQEPLHEKTNVTEEAVEKAAVIETKSSNDAMYVTEDPKKDEDSSKETTKKDGTVEPSKVIEEINMRKSNSEAQVENIETIAPRDLQRVAPGPPLTEEQTEEKNSDVEMEEGEIPFIDEKDGMLEEPLDIDGMIVSVEEAPLAVDDTKTPEQIEENVEEEKVEEKSEEPTEEDKSTSVEDLKSTAEETNAGNVEEVEREKEALNEASGGVTIKMILVGIFFVFLAAVLALLLVDVAAIARAIKFTEPEKKPEPKPFWKLF